MLYLKEVVASMDLDAVNHVEFKVKFDLAMSEYIVNLVKENKIEEAKEILRTSFLNSEERTFNGEFILIETVEGEKPFTIFMGDCNSNDADWRYDDVEAAVEKAIDCLKTL